MRKYFIVSQWWDRVMGWWLWFVDRPRCARSPFEPPPQVTRAPTSGPVHPESRD